MNVLGLDLSLASTGWALGEPGSFPDVGRIRTASVPKGTKTKPNPIFQLQQANRIAHDILPEIQDLADSADFVVLEDFSYGSVDKSLPYLIGGLGYAVRVELVRWEIPWLALAPGKVKIYATGDGRAEKTDVVVSVRERFGPNAPRQNDEVDAFVLWAMAQDADGHPLVDLPKSHRRALKGVEWPLPAAGMAGL